MAHRQNSSLGGTPGHQPRMLAYQLKYFNELSLNLARMLRQQKETLRDGILVVDDGVTTPLLNLFLDGIKLPGRSVTRFFNRRNEATKFAYTMVFTPQLPPQLLERVERGSPEPVQRSLALMEAMFEDTSVFDKLTNAIKQSEHYKDSAFFKREDCTQAAKQALAGVWLFIPSAGAPPPQQWLPTPKSVGHDMPAVHVSKAKPKKRKKGKGKGRKRSEETTRVDQEQRGADRTTEPSTTAAMKEADKEESHVAAAAAIRPPAAQKRRVGSGGDASGSTEEEQGAQPCREAGDESDEMGEATCERQENEKDDDATEDRRPCDAVRLGQQQEEKEAGDVDASAEVHIPEHVGSECRAEAHENQSDSEDTAVRQAELSARKEEDKLQDAGEQQQRDEELEAEEQGEQNTFHAPARGSTAGADSDVAQHSEGQEEDNSICTEGQRHADKPATTQHSGNEDGQAAGAAGNDDDDDDDDDRANGDESGGDDDDDDGGGDRNDSGDGHGGDRDRSSNDHDHDDDDHDHDDDGGGGSGNNSPVSSESSDGTADVRRLLSANESERSGDGSWFARQLQNGSFVQWLQHDRVASEHDGSGTAAQESSDSTADETGASDSSSQATYGGAAGWAGESARMSEVLARAEADSREFEATDYAVVYENDRCFFRTPARVIHRVPGFDRPPWSDNDGNRLPPKDEYPLPEHHEWVGEWRVDMEQPCDEEGWQYASIASSTYTASRPSLDTFRRRRKWVRAMRRTNIKYPAMLQDPVVRGFLGDVTWRDRVDDIVAFILEQPMKLYQTVTAILPFQGDVNAGTRQMGPQQDTVWRTRVIPASAPVSRTASTRAPVTDDDDQDDDQQSGDAATGHCTIDIEFVDVNPDIELLTVKSMFSAAPNVGYRTEEEVLGDVNLLNRMVEEQHGWCARCRGALTILEPTQPLQYCGVCFFTGKVCCTECMHATRAIIPWRAIEFCDFTAYPVNLDAGEGLALLAVRPMYNWSVFAASTEHSYEAEYPSMARLASTGRPQLERGFGLMEALHSQLMDRIGELDLDVKSVSPERLQRASEFLYRNPHFLQDTLIFTMDNLRDLIAEVQDGEPRLTREMREAVQNVPGLQSPSASFLPFRLPFC